MGDFTSEKEQKLLESEAEVSDTEDTNADELTFEETSGFLASCTFIFLNLSALRL